MNLIRMINQKTRRFPQNLKKKSILAVGIAIVLVASFRSSSSNRCRFPAVFNFGDSNSDTGAASAAFGRVPPPNGGTFFGKPSGRYSDGRLIIDFIAEKLGLPFLHAYLDSIQSNFRHGANFAVSGSTIQQVDAKLYGAGFNPLSLNTQLLQFEEFKDRVNESYHSQAKISQSIGEVLPRVEDFSKALYTIDSGQNDLHYSLSTMREEQVKASIPGLINQFAISLEKLYNQGARIFWIHNTGPIGCLPLLVTKYSPKSANTDQNGCIISYNEVAQEFNKQLKDRISHLRSKLRDSVLIYVDIYSAKYSLISEAKIHGFIDPVGYCYRYPGDSQTYCWDKVTVNGTERKAVPCNDPSKYISWDSVHYTEAANRWIANQIIDGSFSDPPIPLTETCQRSLP